MRLRKVDSLAEDSPFVARKVRNVSRVGSQISTH
jgi:hypothetical protein